ncbi:MAG: omptin family outer membrane protease [Spirochaetaceae bacterium]|jgi:outer membrane protease|nr:omptin family outer membrane protease [Spirochaetaceae bacterium]
MNIKSTFNILFCASVVSAEGSLVPPPSRLRSIVMSLRRFFFIVLLISIFFPVFAQTEESFHSDERVPRSFFQNYTIALSTSAGALLGRSEEIVFWGESDTYLSQLLWDMLPVWYFGVSFELAPANELFQNDFFLMLSLQSGLPGKSGVMQDRDWMPGSQTFSGELTDFSEHTNKTRGLFMLEAKTGWNFPLDHSLALRPYLNLSYYYFSFAAQDGYGKYKNSNWQNKPFYGEVITYTQIFFALSPGISALLPFGKFGIEWFGHAGYVLFFGDEDNHITTKTQYLDSASKGLLIGTGIKFSIQFGMRFQCSLSAGYTNISLVRGHATARSTDTGKTKPQGEIAGAGLSLFNCALTFTFFNEPPQSRSPGY